ncbi:MAG: TVP38/TMEM64 family protein [Clostridia bacterium]|nr:TVP38/TMEM64 family protein [Clostridia bacterium]
MKESAQSRKNRKIVTAASVVLVCIALFLLSYYVLFPMVRDFQDPEYFRSRIADKGFMGKVTMVALFMLQIFFAFLPGEVFEVSAGYAFGGLEGSILCIIGTALSSTVIFLLVKRFGVRLVALFFEKHHIDQWSFMKNSKKRNLLTFLLFLIPGTPKDLLTYFIGLTPMNLPTFLMLTVPARLPSLLSSTLTGGMLGSEKYIAAIVLYGITLILSCICIIWYRKESKQQKPAEQPKQTKDSEKTEDAPLE